MTGSVYDREIGILKRLGCEILTLSIGGAIGALSFYGLTWLCN